MSVLRDNAYVIIGYVARSAQRKEHILQSTLQPSQHHLIINLVQLILQINEDVEQLERQHYYYLEEFSNYYFSCQQTTSQTFKESSQQNIVENLKKKINDYLMPKQFNFVHSPKYPLKILESAKFENLENSFLQQIESNQNQIQGMVYSNSHLIPHLEYNFEFELNEDLPDHTAIGVCTDTYLAGELWPKENIRKLLCCSRFKEGVNKVVNNSEDFQGRMKKLDKFQVRICVGQNIFQISHNGDVVESDVKLTSLTTKQSNKLHLFIAVKMNQISDKKLSLKMVSKQLSIFKPE